MNAIPRIKKETLEIINADNGSILRTMNLPAGAKYGSPLISGDTVTIGIQFNNGRNISRVYNINTGSLQREIQM